ncbi:acyltransferase [Pantoea agglomerans]|uniref:acyltransferase family protein n=1 Tax=Enterobacter agglomerans TaxID=549 RepID=UPI003C7D7C99
MKVQSDTNGFLRPNFEAANGIRGLAVLIVLIAHSVGMFFPNIGAMMPGTGKIGVWLFFSLSAFLLTNNFIYKGFSSDQVISYVIGRAIRILPLYSIAVFTYYYFDYYGFDFIKKLFLMDTPWGHLWTVSVEFKFYFLLPFIAFILIRANKLFGNKGVILTSAILVIAHQICFPYLKVQPSSTDMLDYASAFIPGMAVSFLINSNKKTQPWLLSVMAVFILCVILISIPAFRLAIFGMPVDNYLLNKHLHFAFLWSIFIWLTVNGRGIVGSAMTNKVIMAIGKWSFSIYLFHWLIYTQMLIKNTGSVVFSILAPLSAIALGMAVYYTIEFPIEKTRHLIMRKIVRKNQ